MSDFDPRDYDLDDDGSDDGYDPGSPGSNYEFSDRISGNDEDGAIVDIWTNTDPFVDHNVDWDRVATNYLNDQLAGDPEPERDYWNPNDLITDDAGFISMADAVEDESLSIFSYGFSTAEEAWKDLEEHGLVWNGQVVYDYEDDLYYPAFDTDTESGK